METTPDLGATFEQDVLAPDSYATVKELAFANGESVNRFLELLHRLEEKTEAGEGNVGRQALKLGMCHLLLSRQQRAIHWLQKAERCAESSYYLGQAYLNGGRYHEAASRFEEAAEQGWDRLECDCLRAESLLLAGDEDKAVEILDRHVADGGDSACWFYTKGRLAQQRGDLDEAIECFEAALDRDEEHAASLFHLAYILDLHGSDERARELYLDCTCLPFVHANALFNLAVMYDDDGEYEAAAQCFRRVLAVDPNNARVALYLKGVLAARDMYIDEQQVKEREKQNAVLDIPVTDFELSVRSRNCLKKMNIFTLGDLLRTTEAELLGYKNFGETSLREIRAMLTQKGLRLGQNAVEPTSACSVAVLPAAPHQGDPELLARPVSCLELSVRARRCLQGLNIGTLGDLVARTEAELLASRNFGQTSLNEIKGCLVELGLSLRTVE
ncbi:MAG: tetratricopeptide repeat protein [Phycisphaerae bacterium]|nr:tetratricopeptide repeat protein [Phycisphaerae bacterium]